MNHMTKDDYMKMMADIIVNPQDEQAPESNLDKRSLQEDIESKIVRAYEEKNELLYKLCEAVCRKFGTRIVVENIPLFSFSKNGPAGTYCAGDNIIQVNSPLHSPLPWKTIAHELGHAIVYQYRLMMQREKNESPTAGMFDVEKIRQEVMTHYDEIQRYCFAPYIQAVEKIYGAGAFDVILAHTREHNELNQLQIQHLTQKADKLLTALEKCGYVDALIEYLPIIKSTHSLGKRNYILTDLFGAYFNFDYLTHESHSFSYYQEHRDRDANELFANLMEYYFFDRTAYAETKQYLPDTVALFETILDLVYADLGIDKTLFRYEPAEGEMDDSFRCHYVNKYPADLTLQGNLDDIPKVSAILQKNVYYKMLFRKNHHFGPYVAMYNYYRSRLAPLFITGALSETEFSKMVNNNFIVQFYEVYKDSSFIEGIEKERFIHFWKEYISKKYVKDPRELFSKTKYDMILVMFPVGITEKQQASELRLVKKGQPDARVHVGFWNYSKCKEIMFFSKKR